MIENLHYWLIGIICASITLWIGITEIRRKPTPEQVTLVLASDIRKAILRELAEDTDIPSNNGIVDTVSKKTLLGEEVSHNMTNTGKERKI